MKNKIANKHNWILIYLLGVLILMLPTIGFGQSKLSREEIKAQLGLTDQLLDETKEFEEKSLTELYLLSTQIGLREQYLDKVREELAAQNTEIEELNHIICQMEKNIEAIMKEYAQTARVTYKEFDADNFWLTLLSSENVTEAYYRAVYFHQFSQYRKKQIKLLRQNRDKLDIKVEELNTSVSEKEALLEEFQTEEEKVKYNKVEKEKLFTELKPMENTFRKTEARKKEEIKTKIQFSEEDAENIETVESNVVNTNIETRPFDYAAGFLKNKGKMPWPIPTNRGIITEHFGKSEDPYGNPITNEGIYIRTIQGQEIKAVFTGKVTGVQKLPMNGGEVVIIEHGNYRTVYANLESSQVQLDQLIEQDEIIGKVKTNKRTGESILNFLIYKSPDQFDDPEKWIIKK